MSDEQPVATQTRGSFLASGPHPVFGHKNSMKKELDIITGPVLTFVVQTHIWLRQIEKINAERLPIIDALLCRDLCLWRDQPLMNHLDSLTHEAHMRHAVAVEHLGQEGWDLFEASAHPFAKMVYARLLEAREVSWSIFKVYEAMWENQRVRIDYKSLTFLMEASE
jgi:hypothetical protein